MTSQARSLSIHLRRLPVGMFFFFCCLAAHGAAQQDLARRILDATDVQGGFVVQVGVGDGKLTAALQASDRYLVHGVDTSADKVQFLIFKGKSSASSLGRRQNWIPESN